MAGADQSERTGLDQSGRTGFFLFYRSEAHTQVNPQPETAYYLTPWCERILKPSAANAHHIAKQRRLQKYDNALHQGEGKDSSHSALLYLQIGVPKLQQSEGKCVCTALYRVAVIFNLHSLLVLFSYSFIVKHNFCSVCICTHCHINGHPICTLITG